MSKEFTFYEYTVEGQYIYAIGKVKATRPYQEKFVLALDNEGIARAQIQKNLIGDKLQEDPKKYENYCTVRTCQIVDKKQVKPNKNVLELINTPINVMTRGQLCKSSSMFGLLLNTQRFENLTELREAVVLAAPLSLSFPNACDGFETEEEEDDNKQEMGKKKKSKKKNRKDIVEDLEIEDID